jgi:hypothetical protein
MLTRDTSRPSELPELSYGSLWLVGTGDGDPGGLTPLAVKALGTADAVVHDPGIAQGILDLVKLPRYREAATPERAIARSLKLAEDGWRVVHLIEGNAAGRAGDIAIRCAERNIQFCTVRSAREPLGVVAPLGFLLLRPRVEAGGADTEPSFLLVLGTPQFYAAAAVRRTRPLDFSLSGLAG